MEHVTKLDLHWDPQDLLDGLQQVLAIAPWHPDHRQIGLTHSLGPSAEAAWHDATGSLAYVWGDAAVDDQGQLRRHEIRRSESDFRWFVSEFSHTIWQDVCDQLSRRYTLGRVRLMMSRPRTCLSWHTDDETRVHIPLVTNPGAHLVIEDRAYHMPADGHAYLANTRLHHTAFNGGMEPRIHMVACIL